MLGYALLGFLVVSISEIDLLSFSHELFAEPLKSSIFLVYTGFHYFYKVFNFWFWLVGGFNGIDFFTGSFNIFSTLFDLSSLGRVELGFVELLLLFVPKQLFLPSFPFDYEASVLGLMCFSLIRYIEVIVIVLFLMLKLSLALYLIS